MGQGSSKTKYATSAKIGLVEGSEGNAENPPAPGVRTPPKTPLAGGGAGEVGTTSSKKKKKKKKRHFEDSSDEDSSDESSDEESSTSSDEEYRRKKYKGSGKKKRKHKRPDSFEEVRRIGSQRTSYETESRSGD